jgi:8-oxo-dGTP pyrophosphatase MutT (NUDIX family)
LKLISAALLLTNGYVFLGCHSTGNKFYDLPKGQIDEGETAIDTCIRETKEETGLLISENNLVDIGIFSYTKQKDLHIFIYQTDNLPDIEQMDCTSFFTHPYTKKPTKEVDGYLYISFDEKEKYVTKSMNSVLDKVKENIL